jgi:hypothetical protein
MIYYMNHSNARQASRYSMLGVVATPSTCMHMISIILYSLDSHSCMTHFQIFVVQQQVKC